MNNFYVHILRLQSSTQGTHGRLLSPAFSCHTLELPWRNNQKNISCIPPGEYKTVKKNSPKFGEVFHVTGVPDRSYIYIHSGNWAGDINKGYKSDVYGCILIGLKYGTLMNQVAVLNSRLAVLRFKMYMQNIGVDSFILKIHEWR